MIRDLNFITTTFIITTPLERIDLCTATTGINETKENKYNVER